MPTNTKRYFRGERRPEVFPIGESNEVNDKAGSEKEGQRWSCCLGTRYGQRWTDESYIRLIAPTIRENYEIQELPYKFRFRKLDYRKSGIQGKDIMKPNAICDVIDNHPKNVIAPTIGAEHHNTADVHFVPEKSSIRRLTPKECERLQGFPDGWTEGISDTQRYKCLGNAVSVPVVKELGLKLIKSFR